ncbi:MAG: hypothetical protein KZQ77_15620, partial [Candidatus Thiodiazotropha sp. (ex Notomyrtea botanica)]|nr:hypothetical protein [Candidatus Thiodiazotropha sp. (ex Notomyrtea botanica)]
MLSRIVSDLGQIHTAGDLRQWHARNAVLFRDDGNAKALLLFIEDYVRQYDDDSCFEVSKFLSEDLSCIMYDDIPVIYLGSNNWSPVRFGPESKLFESLSKWRKHLHRLVKIINAPVYLSVIPEKDVVVRELMGCGHQNRYLTNAVDDFVQEFSSKLSGYTNLKDITESSDTRASNYRYYDSHLLSRDYLSVFIRAIQSFGLSSKVDWTSFKLRSDHMYGDLAMKLGQESAKEEFLVLDCAAERVELIAGEPSFSSPLRSTFQSFYNPLGAIDARVAIFGDSHSSIYSQKKMTYL